MPWVTLYRDLQKLTDKRKNTCKKLKCHKHVSTLKNQGVRKKKMYHAVRKKKNVSGCQKENIALDLRKKWLIALQKYTCHLKKKKKTAALYLEWIFSPNIVQSYLCCRPWKQRHLRLYQCQTLSKWPLPKWTKVATSPTMSAVSHPGFLKFLTRFHEKINPQKSSKDFDVQNPERSSTTEPPPQIHNDLQISHSNLCRFEKNFTKLMKPLDPLAHNLQNLKISSPKMVVRASTRRQNLSIDRGLSPQNGANLPIIFENWIYHDLLRP